VPGVITCPTMMVMGAVMTKNQKQKVKIDAAKHAA
jgi:hypothetical protein